MRFVIWIGRDEGVKNVNFLRKFKEKWFPLKYFFFPKYSIHQLTTAALFRTTMGGKIMEERK